MVNILTRLLNVEKQLIALSKRITCRANDNEFKCNTNAREILETEANLVEAVVDEFNAFIGEDE